MALMQAPQSCLCVVEGDHEHESPGMGACTACGDCCLICGDISRGFAFRACNHRDFSDNRDNESFRPIRQCQVCFAYDGEHDWEVHNAEMKAGY